MIYGKQSAAKYGNTLDLINLIGFDLKLMLNVQTLFPN